VHPSMSRIPAMAGCAGDAGDLLCLSRRTNSCCVCRASASTRPGAGRRQLDVAGMALRVTRRACAAQRDHDHILALCGERGWLDENSFLQRRCAK